jgi:hypothetical protein
VILPDGDPIPSPSIRSTNSVFCKGVEALVLLKTQIHIDEYEKAHSPRIQPVRFSKTTGSDATCRRAEPRPRRCVLRG